MIRNTIREKLESGQLTLGVGIRFARTTETAKMMKVCGWDWLWPDLEHGALELDFVSQLVSAGLNAGMPSLVRVPPGDLNMAARVLDNGAVGVVMPHVETAEEARVLARRLRFPPKGHRSITANAAQLEYGNVGVAEATKLLNDLTFITVMLESPQAIENADAIAAVEGIDALMIGSNDLAAELGIPGQLGDLKMMHCYEKLVAACRKHGKYAAMAGCYDPALMERYIRLGVRLVVGGGDSWFMMEAAKAKAASLAAIPLVSGK